VPLRPSYGRGQRPEPGQPQPRALDPGTYLVTVTCGDESATQTVEVLPDPRRTGR